MVIDKIQCETDAKPKYEILLNTGFIDYSSIWSLAQNPAEIRIKMIVMKNTSVHIT